LVVVNLHEKYFISQDHFQVRNSRIAQNNVT